MDVRKIHMATKQAPVLGKVPPFSSGILTLQFVPTNMLVGTLTALIPYLLMGSLPLQV